MHARTRTPVVTCAPAPELTQHMCCNFYIAQHTIIAQPSKLNHEYRDSAADSQTVDNALALVHELCFG